jgi:uncharacterized protein
MRMPRMEEIWRKEHSMQNNNAFRSVHVIVFILVVVGALNWGLVGAFDFNLVTAIFGENWFSRLVFILVGLAALIVLYTEFMMVRTGEKVSTRTPAIQG